ncbi:MAG: hypothetical protein HYS12_24260 [Planctomycetes bacterium]|nr:hypothetical protein [Planctomycetota bacterium]
MQWHPLFAYLLRPLVESHYEVRTEQPVGDLPRQADIVLLHKTTAGPSPFQGLWRRLTTWNMLEYKGPTVSPRLDELHDLLELGLGIHRRLNELQAKENQPAVDYAEVSFWYLVHHLGRRFLGELPSYLPDVQQVTAGIWQAHVFAHPVLLVSAQELEVERDSILFPVLAGVPEQERGTITDVLKAEPALWATYGVWLAHREPAIWQEIVRMAAEQNQSIKLDFTPLAEYLRETADRAGMKSLLEALGVKEAVEAVGTEDFWAKLSPEQREELRRLAQQDNPAQNDPTG